MHIYREPALKQTWWWLQLYGLLLICLLAKLLMSVCVCVCDVLVVNQWHQPQQQTQQPVATSPAALAKKTQPTVSLFLH